MPNDDRELTRLDTFLDALVAGRPVRDQNLDHGIAAAARLVHETTIAPPPNPGFARALRQSLLSQAAPSSDSSRQGSTASARVTRLVPFAPVSRWWPAAELAVMTTLILALIGAYLVWNRATPTSSDTKSTQSAPAADQGVPSSSSPPAAEPLNQPSAILFIIDKSGSMSYDPLGDTSKIELEKEALRRALRVLPDGSQFGILAFNDTLTWVVPIRQVNNDADRQEIERAIDAIRADGGSELGPALTAGFDALAAADAVDKQIILLTDGKSRDDIRPALQNLVARAQADGITISTIAVGDDADTDLLQFLAEHGNGRYHLLLSEADIPTVTVGGPWQVATPMATPEA